MSILSLGNPGVPWGYHLGTMGFMDGHGYVTLWLCQQLAIEHGTLIVDFTIDSMVIFQFVFCERLPEGKSHKIPLNHHKIPLNHHKIPLNPIKPPLNPIKSH